MRLNHPTKLRPISAAVETGIVAVELDAAAMEVALRLPRKEAVRELATRLTEDLDAALKEAIEAYTGYPLTDPTTIKGRLSVHPDHPDTPEEERGEAYAMDGDVAILWAGPVKLEGEGDTMRASRALRHYAKAVVGSAP